MDLQLVGRTALVTGSSSGIGEGVAAALGREGVVVAVHGRNVKRAEQVANRIIEGGGKAVVVIGDLSTDAGAAQIAQAALSQLGRVDILVNNAGRVNLRGDVPWLEVTEEELIQMHNDNVVSAFRMTRRLVPDMKRHGWGRVLMTASVGAFQPLPTIPDYCASKAALVNLTVGLAKAVAGTGVTVNSVSPGLILTPSLLGWMQDASRIHGWEGDQAAIEERCCKELFGLAVSRLGRVEEVGNLVAYLASPIADFITGSNFRIDGGLAKSIN